MRVVSIQTSDQDHGDYRHDHHAHVDTEGQGQPQEKG